MDGNIHASTATLGSSARTPRCVRCKGPHRLVECPNKRREWVPMCIICGGLHLPSKCPNQKPVEPKCLLCKGPHRLRECPRYQQIFKEDSDEEEEAYEMPTDDEVVEDNQTDGQGAHQHEVVVDEGNDQVDGRDSYHHEAKDTMSVEYREDDKAKEEGPRQENIQFHKITRVEEPRKEAAKKKRESFQWGCLEHNDGLMMKSTTTHREAQGCSVKFTKVYDATIMMVSKAIKGHKERISLGWYPTKRRYKANWGGKRVGGRKPLMVHGRASIVGVLMACVAGKRWRLPLSGRQGIGWG